MLVGCDKDRATSFYSDQSRFLRSYGLLHSEDLIKIIVTTTLQLKGVEMERESKYTIDQSYFILVSSWRQAFIKNVVYEH